MSTDTAFALGVLALVAPGGTRLRVRLLTLAIFDDLVALLIIATVYSDHLSIVPLAVAPASSACCSPSGTRRSMARAGRRAPRRGDLGRALRVGHRPGHHRTRGRPRHERVSPGRTDLERVTESPRSFREQPTPELARSAQLSVASAISANERLQYRLHPWTSFVIVPLFALANAGIHLDGQLLGDAITSPITLGILFGYVVGKPLGILAAAWLASRGSAGCAWR